MRNYKEFKNDLIDFENISVELASQINKKDGLYFPFNDGKIEYLVLDWRN